MSKQKEGSYQERVQTYITRRGGWVMKVHGSMIGVPGIPDLLCCYKGFFIGIEAKVGTNKPSEQQGIQMRKINRAGGFTIVIWNDIQDLELLLTFIDDLELTSEYFNNCSYSICNIQKGFEEYCQIKKIDDGRKW